LQEQIGAGATGKVYRALERLTRRIVAVKFLKKALVREPAATDQFLREVRTVADLAHPGIVGVQGIGRTPIGGYFLVMELVHGRNLHTASAGGAVDPATAAAWLAAAAHTVHFAHQLGIIHCDLKPSNLLLDDRGAIRVTDFGLAVRLADASLGPPLAGTPAFMAPEQVDACWGPISPRTDVWGLAAVLYFLLFGRPPHAGRSVAEVLGRVVSGQPVEFPSFPSAREQAPVRLIDVCRRGLAKQPGDRCVSAAAFADALESASRCQ
jgi:serine/threonine protein kinase